MYTVDIILLFIWHVLVMINFSIDTPSVHIYIHVRYFYSYLQLYVRNSQF